MPCGWKGLVNLLGCAALMLGASGQSVLADAMRGESDFGWLLAKARDGGGEYRLKALSPERFVLSGTRTDSSCKVARAHVSRSIGRNVWSQNVVMFSVRSASGRLVRIIPEIMWRGGDSRASRRAQSAVLVFQDAKWHNVSLALGADFGLPDADVSIESVALQIDIENWSSGQSGGIEVRNMRLCGAEEVAFGETGEETFTIVPGEPREAFRANGDALKVFFAFDNNDVTPTLRTGKKFSRDNPLVFDAQQCGGFREELLKGLNGAVTWTTNLCEAEAIVYSRCRPDAELAGRIAETVVTKGVPLYAASEVADPAIARLLPCEIGERAVAGFPKRARIRPCGGFMAPGLSDATFGLYRTCRARAGSRTLIEFDDGTPCVAEGMAGRGKVLYTMTAIGQTLVPGKKAYDAFFIRMLSRLTGRPLPEEDANLFAPDSGGWYRGLGKGDCGRFGWEFASGLLVEDLGGTLRVVKGDGEYAFRPADAAGRRDFTFAPSGVSSLSVGGLIGVNERPFARFDGSLAYPGTRWEFRDGRVRLELFGIASHVAIPVGGAIRISDAREAPPPPKLWDAPWMLLFRADGPCDPMLVTLSRRLETLEPIVEDDALAGFTLGASSGGVGMVCVTWPWGNAQANASGWVRGELPRDAAERVALWYPRAFTYPVSLNEIFRRSRDGARFEIVDRYSYRLTDDEWNTGKRPFAPVPPYAYFMKGMLFSSPDRLVDRLATRTGPYADVDGDTVRWSLPVPEPDLSLLPHTRGFEAYDRIANETFREGVKFSSGGGVRFEAVNKAYPGKASVPERTNWNMHGALLGVCRMMPNPFGLDAGNRKAYENRIAIRLLEPLETHVFKMTTRWRVDPMSGARYTIYMNSPRDSFADYSPETFGSKFLYGDSNETIRMIAAALQMVADRHGQYGAAKANRETLFRHVASYAFVHDDWLNMSAGCIERGGSFTIDMLNTEYGGMCSFARLAEICGDQDARVHFLFRAARRMVPTLARLTVVDWQKRSGVIPDDGVDTDFSTGCHETGPQRYPRNPKAVRDVILYDMSQGICQDIVSLYDRYAGDELRKRYFPKVREATPENGLNWVMCAILAIGADMRRDELARRLELCAGDRERHAKLCQDWPGVQTSSYLEYVYAAMSNTPRISDCRDVTLHDAVFDPVTGELTFDYTPGENASLAVESPRGFREILDTSRPAERRQCIIDWHRLNTQRATGSESKTTLAEP